MATKTKIVLDADVIIHFIKGDRFSLLLDIFPEYEYLILDIVYNEVTVNKISKIQIDNTLLYLRSRISKIKFDPKGGISFGICKTDLNSWTRRKRMYGVL